MTSALLPVLRDEAHFDSLWRSHDIWDRAVRALLQDAQVQHTTCARILGGSNIIYTLDDDRILKLFPPLTMEDFEIEVRGLQAATLAKLPLKSPKVLDQGTFESWPWLILERLQGEDPMTSSHQWQPWLTQEDRAHIVGQLGDWMKQSWESEVFQSLELPVKWASWEKTASHLREDMVAKHRRRGADDVWLSQLAPYFESWEPGSEAKVVHADLHGHNLLVSKNSGRWEISGLIDFADCLHAPPLYDLAAPLLYLVQGDRELAQVFYEATLGTSRPLDSQRIMQFALLHRFSHLGYFTKRLHYTKDAKNLEDLAKRVVTF